MTLRSFALVLITASSAAAQWPVQRTPPHQRPLVWNADSLSQQEIALDDSTLITFDVPSFMKRWPQFDSDWKIDRCVGGHWTPSALIKVRLYERYQFGDDEQYLFRLPSLLTWDERPLFCVGRYVQMGYGDHDPLWTTYPGDSLTVGAIRTAVEQCPPEPDPGFQCAEPEIVDRFTNPHGIEVVALTLRFVDGYNDDAPEPDAHTIGPYYALRVPSTRYPYLYLHPQRILAWKPEESRYSDLEVAFVRRVLESARVIEFDEPFSD